MSLFIGYWSIDPAYDEQVREEARGGKSLADANALMQQRVADLRKNLPEGVTLIGSYGPAGGAPGASNNRPILIVDAEEHAALRAISAHYWGVMEFEWVPAISTPITTD